MSNINQLVYESLDQHNNIHNKIGSLIHKNLPPNYKHAVLHAEMNDGSVLLHGEHDKGYINIHPDDIDELSDSFEKLRDIHKKDSNSSFKKASFKLKHDGNFKINFKY